MPHVNRVYAPRVHNAAVASVKTVWEVVADETYHGLHEAGLPANGLFVSVQGSGIVRLGESDRHELYSVDSPQFMFVPRGIPCSYWSRSAVNWKFFYVEFDALKSLETLGMTYSRPYDLPVSGPALQHCRRMIRELAGHSPEADVAAAGEFTRLLVYLARMQKHLEPGRPLARACGEAKGQDDAIRRLLVWMERHVEGRHGVSDFVTVSGLSRRQLYRRFHRVTGISPKQYFLALKIQAASRRLHATPDTVAMIAERYAFADAYHFSRAFSQYMGCAPRAYRRMVLPQSVDGSEASG